ncbi:MAG: coproporphyrinogen III oxidase [Rhodopirellula sp. TMED11]|nr:MAG: coproporphyrinogen III oxidase [Rhodopirellula sp. TMED11]
MHVPFCRHRCGYCNFSVVADRDDLIDRYLNAIEIEITQVLAQTPCQQLDTLFIGGGTPTHLNADQLERLLKTLRQHLPLAENAEWSVEANPEDITPDKLHQLRDAGINRISLGVQSFDDQKLAVLQRSHSGPLAQQVIEATANVIPNVSIDLIFAAPNEDLQRWQSDLQTAVRLPIKHLSTYALTFEKGTQFWNQRQRGTLLPVDESAEIEMYDQSRQMLGEAGFDHYEISNFAQPDHQCRHNMAYWLGNPWYAFGPGAAAFIDHHRNVNHPSTFTYLKRIEQGRSPIDESESITAQQAAREAAAFGARLLQGIDLADIERATGWPIIQELQPTLDQLLEQALIQISNTSICLTERGIHFADTVASELLGETH